MLTNVELLREFVSLIIEGRPPAEVRIKRSAKPGEWRANRDDAFESEVRELSFEPEFASVEAFVSSKLDNDEYTFTAVELQALARNVESAKAGRRATMASPATSKAVKQELIADYGLRFEPREPAKFSRGGMASGHGSSPFAGMGGGGSGFGSDYSGTTFTSFGGGPGAMGGGYEWKKDDKRNLPMGAKKVKR